MSIEPVILKIYYESLNDEVIKLTSQVMNSISMSSEYAIGLIEKQNKILTVMEQLKAIYGCGIRE